MFPGRVFFRGLGGLCGMPLWRPGGSHGQYRLGGPKVLMDHTAWANPNVLGPTAWVDPNVPRADREW